MRPELLPPGCDVRDEIGSRDLAWTQPGLQQNLRVSCDPAYDDEHSESCELWVHGSPLFPFQQDAELAGREAKNCSREDFLAAMAG